MPQKMQGSIEEDKLLVCKWLSTDKRVKSNLYILNTYIKHIYVYIHA